MFETGKIRNRCRLGHSPFRLFGFVSDFVPSDFEFFTDGPAFQTAPTACNGKVATSSARRPWEIHVSPWPVLNKPSRSDGIDSARCTSPRAEAAGGSL